MTPEQIAFRQTSALREHVDKVVARAERLRLMNDLGVPAPLIIEECRLIQEAAAQTHERVQSVVEEIVKTAQRQKRTKKLSRIRRAEG